MAPALPPPHPQPGACPVSRRSETDRSERVRTSRGPVAGQPDGRCGVIRGSNALLAGAAASRWDCDAGQGGRPVFRQKVCMGQGTAVSSSSARSAGREQPWIEPRAALVALCRSMLARLEALELILNQGFPKYGPGGALDPFRGSLGSKLFS